MTDETWPPPEFSTHVSLQNAADQIGRHLHPATWTGAEFEAEFLAGVFAGAHAWNSNEAYARHLFARLRPGRALPPKPVPPTPIGRWRGARAGETTLADAERERREARLPDLLRPRLLNGNELNEADDAVRQNNETAAPQIERREGLFSRMKTAAEAGHLSVSYLDDDSEFREIVARHWRSPYSGLWLRRGWMNPARLGAPLPNWPDSGSRWLFVDKSSLEQFIQSLPPAELPDWCRQAGEPIKKWVAREEVEAEMKLRLAENPNPNKKSEAEALAKMTTIGPNKPVSWKSIDTIRRGN